MLKNKPKTIDWNVGHFEANGRTYYYSDKLSINRYKEFERLAPKVVFGTSITDLAATQRKIFEAVTTGNEVMKSLHLVAQLSYNSLHNIKENFEEKESATLLFCSLILCLENEDTSTWSEQLAVKKIADWKAENIAMESFFLLALSVIPKLKSELQNISKVEKDRLIQFIDTE